MSAAAEIRAALEVWSAAFCAKDADRLMELYAADAVVYDAIPPFAEGVRGTRAKLTDCLPYFPAAGFGIEMRDLAVEASGELAVAYRVWRFTGLPADHGAAQGWLRSTSVWRRQQDGWRIVHEHCSVPFDPVSERAVRDPAVAGWHDPCEIVSTRNFPYPREAVFAAWIDPARLARWWGPQGFRNSFAEFDPRPGGQWRFTMHGPDGKDYANHNAFVEVVAPVRIVLDHLSQPQFRLLATFHDAADGTRLRFVQVFGSAEIRDAIATYAVPANEQVLDRLGAELARE